SWASDGQVTTHEVDLFEVHTDDGPTGFTAFPSFPGGINVEGAFESTLIGEDPREIEQILEKLKTIDFLGIEARFFELAMWDILGKSVGEPIWRLLGGDPSPIPAYASMGERKSREDQISYVEKRIDEGFDAVKMRFGAADPEDDRDLPLARYIREEFQDLVLMVDANMGWSMQLEGEKSARWSPKTAQYVASELEEIGVAWLEEPLPMHNYERLAELRAATSTPIAGGESVQGIVPLREYIEYGSLDILQPDVVFATGIRQGKAIADAASMHGLEFAPHTWSNGLGLAANLHLMAATDVRWCEYPLEPPGLTPAARDFFLENPIDHRMGSVTPPTDPGLGVQIDWSAVEKSERPI
ncbi:MAG: mandelate racemase/muconate lactonizing enzyme family protein, partial [Halobacteriaceae archaeon]